MKADTRPRCACQWDDNDDPVVVVKPCMSHEFYVQDRVRAAEAAVWDEAALLFDQSYVEGPDLLSPGRTARVSTEPVAAVLREKGKG